MTNSILENWPVILSLGGAIAYVVRTEMTTRANKADICGLKNDRREETQKINEKLDFIVKNIGEIREKFAYYEGAQNKSETGKRH